MSPMINGYSIYVAPVGRGSTGWIVRVYRDSDDEHVHSSEPAATLFQGLQEAERHIREDMEVSA